jgi:hypothetical protein
MMIVVSTSSFGRAALTASLPPRPDPLPPRAREAQAAARAVLDGELDLNKASVRYCVGIPVLEAWLRALLSAGLVRRPAAPRR